MAGSDLTIIPFLNNVIRLILNPIVLLLFGIATIYFIYGIVKFLSAGGDDKSGKRVEARNSILWGFVGMVIMFSVFGIIHFVLGTFGINSVDPMTEQFIKP